MDKTCRAARLLMVGALWAAAGVAHAEDGFFSNMDFTIGGFIRPEFAYSTSSRDNPFNQLGNEYNGRSIERQAYVPPNLIPAIAGGLGIPLPEIGTWHTLAFPTLLAADANSPALRGVANNGGGGSVGTALETVDNDINYAIVRAEVELGVRITSNLSLIARLRGIYDITEYDDFDARRFDAVLGGIDGGDPGLYQGKVNYFDYRESAGMDQRQLHAVLPDADPGIQPGSVERACG